MKTCSITNYPNMKDSVMFLERSQRLVRDRIQEYAREKNITVNLVMLTEYKKLVSGKEEIKEINFKTTIIYPSSDKYMKEAARRNRRVLLQGFGVVTT